jgi:hypothetical protein
MFEGLSLCGREAFGVCWCPFAVSRLPYGSGRSALPVGWSLVVFLLAPLGSSAAVAGWRKGFCFSRSRRSFRYRSLRSGGQLIAYRFDRSLGTSLSVSRQWNAISE